MPRDIMPPGDSHLDRDTQQNLAVSTPSPTPKRGRPRKANAAVSPRIDVPTGAPIAETPQETAVGGGQTSGGHPSGICLPLHQSAASVLDAGGGGEDRATSFLTPRQAAPDLAIIIENIITLQKDRTFWLRNRNRLNNATVAYVRRRLGFEPDAPEAQRKKINARALSIVEKVEKGKPLADADREIAVACSDIILTMATARVPIDDALKGKTKAESSTGIAKEGIEQKMEKWAKKLPVWAWVKDVKGFGALGLAVVVGEAGDLSNYANPGKLWKRMGLAPLRGKAAKTWRQEGGLTSEDWIWFGYKPARRSEMWNRAPPIVYAQISRVKDADGEDTGERISTGPYGKVYLDRKKYELDRDPEMSKMYAHNRAARYMEKRLLKHLWQAWRGLPVSDDHVPSS